MRLAGDFELDATGDFGLTRTGTYGCSKCLMEMWLRVGLCASLGTMRMLFPGRASAVLEGSALSDLDNITIRIADVAARLAVLGDRLSDELRSSTFP